MSNNSSEKFNNNIRLNKNNNNNKNLNLFRQQKTIPKMPTRNKLEYSILNNENQKIYNDELLNNHLITRKIRTSKSEKNKMHKSFDKTTFSNGNGRSQGNMNSLECSSMYQSINSGQFTTNIQNHLNININNNSHKVDPSELTKNFHSFGQTNASNSTKNYNFNKNLENGHFDSIKNIIENKSILKLKEELLDAKLNMNRLKNENKIIQEKMKTSKSILKYNEQKIEMVKKHYLEIIEHYKKEIENLKKNISNGIEKKGSVKKIKGNHRTSNSMDFKIMKLKNNLIEDGPNDELQKNINKNQNKLAGNNGQTNLTNLENNIDEANKLNSKFKETYFLSTLSILLDLIEIFLNQKPIYTTRDSGIKTNTENASYSIDIYDSYNNDDERRILLIEQIQSIILSKLKFLSLILNINLDKEIVKIKNWSNIFNKENNINSSISLINNISQMKNSMKKEYTTKEKDGQSYTSSDPNSSHFFQSPKFYRNISFDSLKENNNDSKLKVFEVGKFENYCVRLNDNDSNQNDSLDFIHEGQLNNSFHEIDNNIRNKKPLNIISSFGNLIQNFGNLDENTKLNYLSNIPPKDSNNINVVNFKTNESDINNNNEASNNINSNSNNNLNEQNDIDNNIVEPKLKFTNTFKKLSIDLNDEPTEFNVEEINVNTNSMDINIQETESYPIILLPIVANKEINNSINISFTNN